MESCRISFIYILAVTGVFALEPFGYGRYYYENEYEPETGRLGYYPMVVPNGANPFMNYFADDDRYYVQSGTNEGLKRVAPFFTSTKPVFPFGFQSSAVPFNQRFPAKQTYHVYVQPGQARGITTVICNLLGLRNANENDKEESKTFVLIYELFVAKLVAICNKP